MKFDTKNYVPLKGSNRGMKRKVTNNQIREIIELAKHPMWCPNGIARKLGISPCTVRRYLDKSKEEIAEILCQ